MIGMRITLGLESNELEAIIAFTERAVEQGVEWEPGTERAQFMEYETRQEQATVATKIKRTLFTAVATEYQDITRAVPTGKVWVVLADEPAPKLEMSNATLYVDNVEVGFVKSELKGMQWPDQ